MRNKTHKNGTKDRRELDFKERAHARAIGRDPVQVLNRLGRQYQGVLDHIAQSRIHYSANAV